MLSATQENRPREEEAGTWARRGLGAQAWEGGGAPLQDSGCGQRPGPTSFHLQNIFTPGESRVPPGAGYPKVGARLPAASTSR